MKKLVIIGAGGHAKVVADAAICSKRYTEVSFIDDCYPHRVEHFGMSIIGKIFDVIRFISPNIEFIIAIGCAKARQVYTEQLDACSARLAAVIHPSAVVADTARVFDGVFIAANAVINPCATVGRSSIINTGSIIEHDCVLGDFVHVSPNATLAGGVSIGSGSWVGAGATIIECVNVGKRSIIGAGAVVLSNIGDDVTSVGVPARCVETA